MTEETRKTFETEAAHRLNILGITRHPTNRVCFGKNENTRSVPFYGNWYHMDILYSYDGCDALEQAVRQCEEAYGCYVYAAIYTCYKNLGDMLTLLTISSDESEWEQEREDLKAMQPIAYVHNFTHPVFSEWGTVLLRMNGTELERIG